MNTITRIVAKGLLITVLFGSAVFATERKPLFVREGVWRGVFTVNEASVPFNFEFKGKDPEHVVFSLITGSRRDDFMVKRIADDSLFIKMNTYDAALFARIESDGRITGEYRKLTPDFRENALPFVAEAGKKYRFTEPGKDVKPGADLSGKWELQIYGKEPIPNRIGLLKQNGNKLTGVIMSVLGDSRELEGTVQGNEFELSGFTGPSPIYIKGHINNDKSFTGELSLGTDNNVKLDGNKNPYAELPDLNKLTYLKEGNKEPDFPLPDLNGGQISLSDALCKGQAVNEEVTSAWYLNCIYHTASLAPRFRKNKAHGVEVIATGFEQKEEVEYARYTLRNLKDKYSIEYDIPFGSIADKKVVSETLPSLNRMMAFPTTITIDLNGDISRYHQLVSCA
ncbi:peroxiredoxin family protein [Chitinophaga rhizophila]|uniref:Peroxiredoxin family protein n=1 Tax=Chitinophaga rhizophila TaxID=2866212 RepID=A0ABS7GDG9_9BACT|nr:redoxin domain-containing protein [Chitinophaga rhizophila]MBW8685721.1 peroxiredoxin family protein [Chitinophaga rhizophila]